MIPGSGNVGKMKAAACRRRSKTGILAGAKLDKMLEAVGPEDGGPDEFWGLLHYPKACLRMVYERDGSAARRGQLPVLAQKIDRVVVIDPPAAAQGEVQI